MFADAQRACRAAFAALVLAACAPAAPDPSGLATGIVVAAPEPRGSGGNEGVASFPAAKRHLVTMYADGVASELYGGCALHLGADGADDDDDDDDDGQRGPRLGIAASGCCFDGKLTLSWEHAVPAAAFGASLPAWRDGDARCVDARGRQFHGRKCASKVSQEFRRMEGDMHNLFPAIEALNQARGSLLLGLVDGEPRLFGRCDFETGDARAEPRPEVRGELARAYEYMDAAYPGRGIIPDEASRALFAAWDAADPPDDFERARNRRIAAIQGNANPFIR